MLQRAVWSTSKRIFWKKIVHFTILLHLCTIFSYKKLCFLTFVKNRNANVYEKHILIIELADITPPVYWQTPSRKCWKG